MSAVKDKVRIGTGSSTDEGPEARAVRRRPAVPLLLNALLVPTAAARDR